MKRIAKGEQRIAENLKAGISAVAIAFVLAVSASPVAQAQTFMVLHSFSGPDGANPGVGLTLDRAGNLYGTTEGGGNTGGSCQTLGCGTVFKLLHAGSGWVFSQLLKFNGQNGGDGLGPLGRVTFGPDGTLYGTASCCSGGTVFNLKPPASRCSSISCPWTETVLFRFGNDTGVIPTGDIIFDPAGRERHFPGEITATVAAWGAEWFTSWGCPPAAGRKISFTVSPTILTVSIPTVG